MEYSFSLQDNILALSCSKLLMSLPYMNTGGVQSHVKTVFDAKTPILACKAGSDTIFRHNKLQYI